MYDKKCMELSEDQHKFWWKKAQDGETMKHAIGRGCQSEALKKDFQKLHTCMWLAFTLEKKAMNAEKLFEIGEMLLRHTKAENAEDADAAIEEVKHLKDVMANYHGAMHANLKEVQKLEALMASREGGEAHAEAVKTLHAEYSTFFEAMKSSLLEQYPVEVEGPEQGLRDKNAAVLQQYGWSDGYAEGAGKVKPTTLNAVVEAPQDSLRCSILGG